MSFYTAHLLLSSYTAGERQSLSGPGVGVQICFSLFPFFLAAGVQVYWRGMCVYPFFPSLFLFFFFFFYIASTVRCEWRGNNRFGREFLIVCPTFFPSILVSTGSSKLFCSKWKKTKNLFQVMCILYSRTMLEPCGNVLSWLLKFVPRFIKVRN